MWSETYLFRLNIEGCLSKSTIKLRSFTKANRIFVENNMHWSTYVRNFIKVITQTIAFFVFFTKKFHKTSFCSFFIWLWTSHKYSFTTIIWSHMRSSAKMQFGGLISQKRYQIEQNSFFWIHCFYRFLAYVQFSKNVISTLCIKVFSSKVVDFQNWLRKLQIGWKNQKKYFWWVTIWMWKRSSRTTTTTTTFLMNNVPFLIYDTQSWPFLRKKGIKN